jgi:large conductance mechanosensitive channel
MQIVREFQKFAMRGSLVDMAVGFTVGAAFTTVARSLVDDIIMPPVGWLLGRADFSDFFLVLRAGREVIGPYATLADARTAGAVTLNYGLFINSIVAFLIVAAAMFALIQAINRLDDQLDNTFGGKQSKPTDPATKKCQYCQSTIPYQATRCPQCTSHLQDANKPFEKLV